MTNVFVFMMMPNMMELVGMLFACSNTLMVDTLSYIKGDPKLMIMLIS